MLGMASLITGCGKTVIIKVPPPCPVPSPDVGQQWEQFEIFKLAPAVSVYMARLKRYCQGIDEFRKMNH
jgi:hypothetical protein